MRVLRVYLENPPPWIRARAATPHPAAVRRHPRMPGPERRRASSAPPQAPPDRSVRRRARVQASPGHHLRVVNGLAPVRERSRASGWLARPIWRQILTGCAVNGTEMRADLLTVTL